MVMSNTVLTVVFAHHDEWLPTEFLHHSHGKQEASARLRKKWKSQRMAFFLLHKLFEQYQLDITQLHNIPRTQSGRPYLPDPRIDFNISHSGEWVAIIFSLATPKIQVGIDIEHPQKHRRYRELLHYYASPAEITDIQNPEIFSQLISLEQRFYLSWCLREAVLKSQGAGIAKLSEVQHLLSQRRIYSAYCPKGTLCFYHQLPFYLAYFFESSAIQPSLMQWQNQQFRLIEDLSPLIYQVNHNESDPQIFSARS